MLTSRVVVCKSDWITMFYHISKYQFKYYLRPLLTGEWLTNLYLTLLPRLVQYYPFYNIISIEVLNMITIAHNLEYHHYFVFLPNIAKEQSIAFFMGNTSTRKLHIFYIELYSVSSLIDIWLLNNSIWSSEIFRIYSAWLLLVKIRGVWEERLNSYCK